LNIDENAREEDEASSGDDYKKIMQLGRKSIHTLKIKILNKN
jgi:hypothetical protein